MDQLSHPYMTTGKTIALTIWTFVGKVMSLLFNMLSRLVIAFLLKSKYLFQTMNRPRVECKDGDLCSLVQSISGTQTPLPPLSLPLLMSQVQSHLLWSLASKAFQVLCPSKVFPKPSPRPGLHLSCTVESPLKLEKIDTRA